MTERRTKLANRRRHVTQKAKIGGVRTLYLSVNNLSAPTELWFRVKGEADTEKVVLYDTLARVISQALQYGVPLVDIAETLRGTKDDIAGPVVGDAHIKMCSGTIDYIGTHLLVNYYGREDLAHVK